MKRAVSISLGSPARDKQVVVSFNGEPVSVERIGTGGDAQKAHDLFCELDGKVEAMSLGGMDYFVRLDGRDYPIRAARRLVQDVHKTPVVDGRVFKYVLERRVFERAKPLLGSIPRFQTAIIPTAIDRTGLAEAVESVSDRLVIGDLMFTLGIPIPVWGLANFKRIARVLLPIVGFLPLSMIVPPGTRGEEYHPKHEAYWREADLIAGDMHYILTYSPQDLSGKTVVTNTTTPENIEALRARGVRLVITSTPIYEGRSFGVNMMEAALTAFADKGRELTPQELDVLINELDLRPNIFFLQNEQ